VTPVALLSPWECRGLRRRPWVHRDLGRVPISPDRQLRLEQHVSLVRDRSKRAGIRVGHCWIWRWDSRSQRNGRA